MNNQLPPAPANLVVNALAKASNNGILITDTERKVVWVNEGFTRLSGYTLGEIIGRKPAEVLQGKDTDSRMIQRLRESFEAPAQFHCELLNYHKSGRPYWILLETTPLFNDEGIHEGFLGIQTDITQRKYAEAAHAASDALFREITNHVSVMIWLCDERAGGIFFNEAWERFTGMSQEEALGLYWLDCLHPADHNTCYQRILGQVKSRQPLQEEFHLRYGKHGYRRVFFDCKPRFNAQGECIGLYGTCVDVEDCSAKQDELEQQLFIAEEAEKAKSQFLSLVNHELRTPLNPIIGCTELMLSMDPPDDFKEMLEMVREAAGKLSDILRDVLCFSESEQGKLEPENSWIPLHAFLQKINRLFVRQCKAKQLHFETESLFPEAQLVWSDDSMILMVVTQLISNAIKFTPQGSIALRADIMSSKDNSHAELRIRVTDTGVGVSPEMRAQIFKAFRQANEGSKRLYGGLGLGLTIARDMAIKLGGRLELTHTSPQGTTFTFTIPVKTEFDYDKIAEEFCDNLRGEAYEKKKGNETLRLLVVEDDNHNRIALKIFFDRQKMRYDMAAHGKEAVALYEKHHHSVILMDIMMPGTTGIDATRQIREISGSKDHPFIIAYSADNSSDAIALCMDAGANYFLAKPASWHEIEKLIHPLL